MSPSNDLECGVCRVCGCTDFNACIAVDGTTCAWANAKHTLCTFCVKRLPKKYNRRGAGKGKVDEEKNQDFRP